MQSPDRSNEEVVILGAGIVGICTALSLLDRGVPVRLIDRDAPGQATSLGNAGVVSPWSFIPQSIPGIWKSVPKLLFGYGRPLSIDPMVIHQMLPWAIRFFRQSSEENTRRSAEAMSHLCGPSVQLYEKHLQGTGHERLISESYYVHAFRKAEQASLRSIDYLIRTEKGADLELVGSNELSTIEPALSPDFKAAVLIKGQSRIRSPGHLGHVLAEKAKGLGAIIEQREITNLEKIGDGWRITCNETTFNAARVVVSMGAWSRKLLSGLGLDIPLMAERGYHIECKDPGIEINNSVMDVDAKVVASSMDGGVRVAGQAEFAPTDKPANPKRKAQLITVAKKAFPDLQIKDPSFWMGRRPSFPDSMPALGKSPDFPGLFMNFGHSHYGLMMAPKSGEIAAQLVCGETPNEPIEQFSPDRFN